MAVRLFKLVFFLTFALLVWLMASAMRHHSGADTENTAGNAAVADANEPASPATGNPAPEKRSPRIDPLIAQKSAQLAADHEKHKQQPPAKPVVKRRVIAGDYEIPIDGLGRGRLDWDVLATTRLDKSRRPDFHAALRKLDGKPVMLTGFLSPLDETGEMARFLLLEFPVGCYFCFAPQPTGLVYVQLVSGKTESLHAEPVKITGVLQLTADDPEDFLYKLVDAEVSAVD